MRSSTSRRWIAALSMRRGPRRDAFLARMACLMSSLILSLRLIAQGRKENQGRVVVAGAGGRGLLRRMSFLSSRLRAAAASRLRISVNTPAFSHERRKRRRAISNGSLSLIRTEGICILNNGPVSAGRSVTERRRFYRFPPDLYILDRKSGLARVKSAHARTRHRNLLR